MAHVVVGKIWSFCQIHDVEKHIFDVYYSIPTSAFHSFVSFESIASMSLKQLI